MTKRREKRRKRRGGLLLLVIIAAVAALVCDSRMRIVTQEYEVAVAGLDERLDGFRIVQLSDLHQTRFGEDNAKLIDAVKECRPDIIVITGDLIDDDSLDYIGGLVPRLCALAPVYYVSGNHEWASGYMKEIFTLLEESGADPLRNESVVIERDGGAFTLAGLEDPNGPRDMKTPEEVMASALAKGYPVVLLAHRNNLAAEYYVKLGAAVTLSGHAHGGLIRLPFTDGLIDASREFLPSYTSGLYTDLESPLVVSRGLGNSVPVPRLLNNPHIPVVILRSR